MKKSIETIGYGLQGLWGTRGMVVIVVLVALSSCGANVYKLTSQGWDAYYENNYRKAEKKFKKALKKGGTARTYEGLAFVNWGNGNYRDAEYYMSQAYNRDPNSAEHTYNYALVTNVNGNSSKAMDLLFEIPDKGDFNFYRNKAAQSTGFNSLRSNPKFQRYLKGYRRLKLQPYYGASTETDKLTANDLFVVTENQGKVILTTTPVQDQNIVYWQNDYVVWDYPLGSVARVSLMDEDYTSHDNLLTAKGSISPGNFEWKTQNSVLKVKISDTEEMPYTTGVSVPGNVSLSQLAAGLGIGVLAVATISDLMKDTPKQDASPFVSCPTSTKNSTDLYVLSVGTDPNVYADNDAYAMTQALRAGCGKRDLFGNVYSITLAGSQATKSAISKAFMDIRKRTNEDDIFVFLFSGHGGVESGVYSFFSYDEETLSVDDIIYGLDGDNCKTVFWFDTCYAGMVKNNFRNSIDDYIKNKACPNVSIMMSSSDWETSAGDPSTRLGFFTKALIDGLKGAADQYPKNRIVSLRELEEYVMREVPVRTGRKQHPQLLKEGRKSFETRLSFY